MIVKATCAVRIPPAEFCTHELLNSQQPAMNGTLKTIKRRVGKNPQLSAHACLLFIDLHIDSAK